MNPVESAISSRGRGTPLTRGCWIVFAFVAMWPVSAVLGQDDGVAFYKEKIHPLLKEHCFKCHGGEEKLKAHFRITSREGLLRGGDYGPGLDETDPAKSLILEMISYKEDDYQMPPKAKLPDEQIALLTKWVEMGAPYDPSLEIKGGAGEGKKQFSITDADREYWAYTPVKEHDLGKWKANPVDFFVKKKLDEAGLKANGAAPAERLARRMFYNLIGLPPTLEEVAKFEANFAKDEDAAVEELIDDLLARPEYGEKWARHWLDIVRYAESNGFERDNPKPEIWRYRDYVIDAFNEDKPYDQFVIEQIAGDEIAKPTQASLTATGFHRLMQWDDEPADRKQHVYDVLADNVLVTTEAFLGMTMGCARCHDHKADPISQKDYYSFMAFFHGVTPYQTPGTIRPWASEEEIAKFEAERKKRIEEKQAFIAKAEADMTAHLNAVGKMVPKGQGKAKTPVKSFVRDAREPNGATWFFPTTQPAPGWKEVGQVVKDWTKSQGGFGNANPPNTKIKAKWDTKEIWMRTNFGSKDIPEKLVLEIYHDEDVEVYLNGVEIYLAKGYVTDYQLIELDDKALNAFQTGKNVLAAHCKQTGGGQYIDMALRTGAHKPDSLPEALRRGGKKLEQELEMKFSRNIVKEWRDAKGAIGQIQRENPGIPLNAVTETGPNPQPLHVHLRGSAHAPGDEVVPAFPTVLSDTDGPKPASFEPVEQRGAKSSGRRLALAKWIASPENPLTGRVMMNRIWQHHFGRGIVASSNDFGKLGEVPTHPELLSFLAAELVNRGWSLKEMHKLIMMSETYRRSSAPNEDNLLKDPSNNLFWRYNMRRLTAEEMRDSMLYLSGKLNLEDRGGKWVYPPLPKEVLATASRPGAGWPISKNERDHYRRSVYIHVKRSLRHQMLADFDQADTDSPCAVRFTTTVPTQALTMLNSKFVNDQAALFAQRLKDEGTVENRVKKGLELAFQRNPEADEVAHCVEMIGKFQSEHELTEDQAMERFALLALNLNEFVYLD
ncbi:MAG: DUF1553 domain-containing protein [Verrucomicrobiales bacterium]|nr:DUF1553 domain-containing protein [Verrucomicrobiales bacterium]